MTVDSGAVDHVGPKHIAEAFEIRESDKSRRGFNYQVANGIEIPNQGEKWISGYGEDWQPVRFTMQVAPVKKVLGSVAKICGAGNKVVFDEAKSRTKMH